ncbi:rhomboid family intramembrane serine protease [Weeksellaceae bacterium TAE3-ERU29]|nr:rhomboid family intramembrane serine protease [Weeksellaceae bacterium TAE3-ERU29]
MDLINKLKYKYTTGNIATKLIFINVAVYLLAFVFKLFTKVNYVQLYFGLSSYKHDFLYKPWSVFTYMFLHDNVLHLLFNMIMLYIVADFYFKFFGEKSFKIFYFVGGIFGGIFFLLFNLIFPEYSHLIGASAAIYAVFFAMVAYQPNLEVRLMFIQTPIKILYLAIGLLALGFFLKTDNIGGNISHLGGALFGYLYMKRFEKGNDFFGSIANTFKNLFKKKSPLKANKKQNTKRETPPRNDYDYNEWKVNNEKKIDAILDKISRSGYNSLTAEEKDFLFKQGKNR